MPRPPVSGAGELRHRITILTPVEFTDPDLGGTKQTWSEFWKCWAKIDGGAGTEQEYADKTQAVGAKTVTIRFVSGVTEKMRVGFKGRIFNISGIDNWLERNIWLTLSCQEIK